MLSSLSATNDTGNNIFSKLDQPQQQAPDTKQVPGTKEGTAPEQQVNPNTFQTQQSPNTQQPQDSTVDPLAAYKKTDDNSNNDDSQQQQKQPQGIQIPKAEEFANIANNVASSIAPPDQELVTAALSGDAEALGKIIAANNAELLGKALHAGAVASNELNKGAQETTAQQVRSDLENTQYVESATNAAIAESPQLKDSFWQGQLSTAIESLRKDYPTAPAQELGKRAAQLLGSSQPQQEPATTSGTDWNKHFGRT